MKKKKEPDLEEELKNDYERWEFLKEYGGSDPFYDDATNMNLVRNHIMYHKGQIEEKYGKNHERYPEIYFREVPPEAEKGYMAMAGEIRNMAAEALELYLSDANFQYLFMNHERLTEKEAKGISLANVLGYASGLAHALKNDDLITMRRHAGRPEGYLESFASCAQKMKDLMENKKVEQDEMRQGVQMSLFDFGAEVEQCR